MPLRVVFFGTPEFAVPTLDALLGIRVIPSSARSRSRIGLADEASGRATHRSRRGAVAAGIPVLQPERMTDPEFSAGADRAPPDLGVVAAYGKILNEPILALPRLGMINVHASLLPRYRGAAPVHRAVINGDARHRRHHHARRESAGRRSDDRFRPPVHRSGRHQRRGRARPGTTRRTAARLGRRCVGRRRCPRGLPRRRLATYAPRLVRGRRRDRLDAIGRRRSTT